MPAFLAPEDGELPHTYTAKRMIGDGIVRNRGDLSRKRRFEGFPSPINKPDHKMRGASDYHGPSVRWWFRNWLARAKSDNPKEAA